MKKRNNKNRQKKFTNIQAQGSSDLASSINKQIRTLMRSKTSFSFNFQETMYYFKESSNANNTMRSNAVFMLQMRRWSSRQGLSVINHRVNAFLTLNTMQGISQEYLQLLLRFNNSVLTSKEEEVKILTFKAYHNYYNNYLDR